MLSVGCTQERPYLSAAGGGAGAGGIYWLGRAIGFMMSAQSSLALGQPNISSATTACIGSMKPSPPGDSCWTGSDLPALIGMGAESAREWKPRVTPVFFGETQKDSCRPVASTGPTATIVTA